jgi:hypothetical protein
MTGQAPPGVCGASFFLDRIYPSGPSGLRRLKRCNRLFESLPTSEPGAVVLATSDIRDELGRGLLLVRFETLDGGRKRGSCGPFGDTNTRKKIGRSSYGLRRKTPIV